MKTKKTWLGALSLMLAGTLLCPTLAGCKQSAADSAAASDTSIGQTTTVTPPAGSNDANSDDQPKAGELFITEVMTSNASTVADSFGEYSDWIELYNASDRTLSLKGCFLSDSADEPTKYKFPDLTLGAHEYLLVFASDLSTFTESGELHVPFKLSAGECVCFSNRSETIATLQTPLDLPEDISYGLMADGEGYMSVYFASPTPKGANGGATAEVLGELNASELGIRINEFMMKNESTLYDEDGDCPDWVELRNCSDKEVSLGGFGLSDSFDDPLKWTFPDITLGAGEYILVLLSGKNKPYDENSTYLHADFKLSDTDDGLMLSNDKGIPIDRIATVALPESASYGRAPDETSVWKFFTRPTPGGENSANGFDTLEVFNKALTEKVYISEVSAVSSSSVSALDNEDWIELYNNTSETVDLGGWSISKYISDLRYYTFPELSIEPYSYVVLSASPVASQNIKSLDAGFAVNHAGNTLYLVDAEGYVTDAFETGLQRAGVTSGRVIENDTLTRKFFSTPSKGKENTLEGSANAYAQPVQIESSAGTLIADRHTVTLSTLEKGGVIYYTLDSSEPNEESLVYTAPLELTESTVLRAVVYADGLLPSEVATQTFLVEDEHSLNVVCLTCDPDDLFGYRTGIWANGPGWTSTFPHKGANFWKDWEKEVFFEYYEKDGTLGISFSAGMKNHGQYSRAQAQKSVSLNLKEAYGSGTTYYPFFGEDEIAVFDNLLLRTGGQDWNYTNLIDAYCERVIAGQMDLDYMRDLPVALYVNGEYWGLYFIREKINESYLYYHQGIEEDNLDLIKGNKSVSTGSYDAHNELLNYIKTHDLSNQEYFDYVATQIDIEEWTNYWIVESFFANTDTGNIRFYCSKDGEGKWRWILFDMDWALYRSTYKWNMIEEFIDPRGHGNANSFSTTIAVGLFKNEDYKRYFIEKYAEYMHTVFDTDRMLAILDELVSEIEGEMVRQCERWGAISYTKWQSNIEKLHTIVAERWEYSKGDLQETFRLSDEYMAELFPEI